MPLISELHVENNSVFSDGKREVYPIPQNVR
jgi:hypothetical protein